MKRLEKALVLSVALLLTTGCLATPTVPVPPPVDDSKIFPLSEPDDKGMVHVWAGDGAFPGWADFYKVRVFVKNLDTGDSVEKDVLENGGFDVWIQAESGHTLSIQGNYHGSFSRAYTVPVP